MNTIDLLNRCLMYAPDNRISVAGALKHAYFQEAPIMKDKRLLPTFPDLRGKKGADIGSVPPVKETQTKTAGVPLQAYLKRRQQEAADDGTKRLKR